MPKIEKKEKKILSEELTKVNSGCFNYRPENLIYN